MSNTIGSVRTLRVYIEPIDVEIEGDESLPWTTLQTAFPGCSGMYYQGNECKSAVKFDGTKFHPPGGAWNDRKYFVSLGQRTHNYPFGSYENASKQFEKSVNAVQRMMGGSLFDLSHRRSTPRVSKTSTLSQPHTALVTPPPSIQTNIPSEIPEESVSISPPNVPYPTHHAAEHEDTVSLTNSVPLRQQRSGSSASEKSGPLFSIKERERELRSSARELSTIEQQFVDLARISTGKDAIIDGQREEMRKTKGEMEERNRELSSIQSSLSSYEKRCVAQEEELNILRRMSSEQTYMCEKVSTLTNQLLQKDQEIASVRAEFAQKVCVMQRENEEIRERNLSLLSQLDEATTRVRSLQVQYDTLNAQNSEMREEFETLKDIQKITKITNMDEARDFSSKVDQYQSIADEREQLMESCEELQRQQKDIQNMSSGLAIENSLLMERNQDLEKRLTNFETEISKINDKWKETMKEREESWQVQKAEMELDSQTARRELESVQRTLESVTRDAAENGRRVSELEHSRDELRHLLDANTVRVQEPLQRQVKALQEQLVESQERVKDLNNLVVSLTADARNSQHDVSDFYYGSGNI